MLLSDIQTFFSLGPPTPHLYEQGEQLPLLVGSRSSLGADALSAESALGIDKTPFLEGRVGLDTSSV